MRTWVAAGALIGFALGAYLAVTQLGPPDQAEFGNAGVVALSAARSIGGMLGGAFWGWALYRLTHLYRR